MLRAELFSGKHNRSGYLILLGLFFFTRLTLYSQQEAYDSEIKRFKLSLNAYSFNDVLLEKDKLGNAIFTLFDLIDWCAGQNIHAIDLTGYYFPTYPEVPSDEYLYKIKQKAHSLGIEFSGTGIRNDFASPDPKIRAAGVKTAKEWIIVAKKLGAPVIRLFTGEVPDGYENNQSEVWEWMIESFKECINFGAQHGIIIGIQNHRDMLQTGEDCIRLIDALNSQWVGIVLDIGSFVVSDPYRDIAAVAPYAVNWQIKERIYGPSGDVKTDLNRIIKILQNSPYNGFIPLETLKEKPHENNYDPFTVVPIFINKVKIAIKNVLEK